MRFVARVLVQPKAEVRDPQGEAVLAAKPPRSTDHIVDCALWSLIALGVQIVAYYLARIGDDSPFGAFLFHKVVIEKHAALLVP